MSTTMLFIHGRGQEFKDPEELRRTWLAGLTAGLIRAGLSGGALDRIPLVLPFYGNVLYGITADLARDPLELESMPDGPDEPAPLHPYLPKDVGDLEQNLLYDMTRESGTASRAGRRGQTDLEGMDQLLAEAGRRTLSWNVTRQALLALARHTPFDQSYISEHLRDVAVYLKRGREQVLAVVRESVPATGSLVIVSHSLGTVVACDLLEDKDIRERTTLWVTAGSPLGLEAVQRNLRHPGPHAMGVDWLTAHDPEDIVALGHPLPTGSASPGRPAWGDVQNIAVDNGDKPHAIDRYLAHPDVARRIGRAW
ncbi:hypothetical protein [Streptomyces sp. NPDC051576]|uniref:hypothetical protein n=1 Tax=Streptomyces sp. NPDC051576 TaxID=3155803 RepID=UPI00342901A3